MGDIAVAYSEDQEGLMGTGKENCRSERVTVTKCSPGRGNSMYKGPGQNSSEAGVDEKQLARRRAGCKHHCQDVLEPLDFSASDIRTRCKELELSIGVMCFV